MGRFNELEVDVAERKQEVTSSIVDIQQSEAVAAAEESAEEGLASELNKESEAIKGAVADETADSVKSKVAEELAAEKLMIEQQVKAAAEKLQAEQEALELEQAEERERVSQSIRAELSAMVQQSSAEFDEQLLHFSEAMTESGSCAAAQHVEEEVQRSINNAQLASDRVQEIEEEIASSKQALATKKASSLEGLLAGKTGEVSDDGTVPSDWSFQERWHIHRLQRRLKRAEETVEKDAKLVHKWHKRQDALQTQLGGFENAGYNVSNASKAELQTFEDLAATAEDDGTGLAPHIDRMRSLLKDWLERSQWGLDSNRYAAEGACAAAMPATDGKKGPTRNLRWAKELQVELSYNVERTFRREVSTAQQRVEEAYFEGRLKSAIEHNKAMQAEAADKEKLNGIVKESTENAAQFLEDDKIVEQLQELDKARRAKVVLQNADAAEAAMKHMEERLQVMQHFRTAQELLEDGTGPLHKRLVQLRRMLCQTSSATSRRLIRGSIRFLERQMKRVQRKLHWGLKRQEQQEFLDGEVHDTKSRADKAQLVIQSAAAAKPALEELQARLQNASESAGPFLAATILKQHLDRVRMSLAETEAFAARGEAQYKLLSVEAQDAVKLRKDLDANEKSIADALEPLKAQHDQLQDVARRGKTKQERGKARERIR